MSPGVPGADANTRWRDYGMSHSGLLEVDINGEYDFIFTDSRDCESYGPSPFVNLRDKSGHEYLCWKNGLKDPHVPSGQACVELDEWTSKLT